MAVMSSTSSLWSKVVVSLTRPKRQRPANKTIPDGCSLTMPLPLPFTPSQNILWLSQKWWNILEYLHPTISMDKGVLDPSETESTINLQKQPLLKWGANPCWKLLVVWRLTFKMAFNNQKSTKSCCGFLRYFCLDPTINWKVDGILFLMTYLCLFIIIQKTLLVSCSWRIELKNWLTFESALSVMKSWCLKLLKSESNLMLLKDWHWRSLKSKSALMWVKIWDQWPMKSKSALKLFV